MKDPEDIELQPLRVYGGWTIDWNTFYEVDPVEGRERFFMGSSLLLLTNLHRKKIIDLEWRPEMDLNGHFILIVSSYVEVFNERTLEFDKEFVEDNTIPSYKTRSREEVVDKLDELMRILPTTPDPRILKKRGVISEPSESFRLELLENGLSEPLISKILNEGNSRIQNILLDHKDINREIVELFFEKGTNKKVKNKATQKLNSKRFRI